MALEFCFTCLRMGFLEDSAAPAIKNSVDRGFFNLPTVRDIAPSSTCIDLACIESFPSLCSQILKLMAWLGRNRTYPLRENRADQADRCQCPQTADWPNLWAVNVGRPIHCFPSGHRRLFRPELAITISTNRSPRTSHFSNFRIRAIT